MIRFTWLQARTQSLVAIGALAIVAVAVAINGPHLIHLYNTKVATCAANSDCSAVTAAFLRNGRTMRIWLGVAVIAIPGVIGIFWGAPLVARELETGTFRLMWTQSVTRTRWLAVKLAVIGLASMAVAGLLSLAVTWWASPLDRARMDVFATFDQRDIVPIGHAAFAFALGVTAGLLIRRTLPAMATTLVAFVAARLGFIRLVRPHLMGPIHQSSTINATSVIGFGSNSLSGDSTLQLRSPNIPNAWIYSTRLVDNAGGGITTQYLKSACPSLVDRAGPPIAGSPGVLGVGGSQGRAQVPADAQNALHDCAAKAATKFHEVVTYQPGSRYWTFQWYEVAIFVGAAVVLAGLCFWWVRRRLS